MLELLYQTGVKFCLMKEKNEVKTHWVAGNKQSRVEGLWGGEPQKTLPWAQERTEKVYHGLHIPGLRMGWVACFFGWFL